MNQIAHETSISKGKVHYLITDWINKISISDIEKIRNFTVLVRKSNMSIEQCAQGFRMINIMKNLGIQDDNTVYVDDGNEDIENSKYNELSTFIQDIYLTCKNLRVTPSHIFSRIKDLPAFRSKSNSNIINSSASLIERDNAFDKKNQ